MQEIFDNLNPSQLEAVQTIDGPILILAGAGSGKTKTIISRLAYLIGVVGIDPSSILTLTFTNKAALEMRERALELLFSARIKVSHPPLLCTFHKFGLMFLKFHIEKLGRKNNFIIVDSDDRKRIIKSFDSKISSSIILGEISHYKNSLLEPKIILKKASDEYYKEIASLYERYELYLEQNNLVDFDDLLLLPYKILESDGALAYSISQKYQYIMIDEYQDTNELQYLLVKKLCYSHENICVVGDDDQSIYGWRGANIKNILEFSENFQDTKIIKLEQNYRSTSQILKAANDLISHNRGRLGKTLISTKGDGKDIEILESIDEKQESSVVANKISNLIKNSTRANQIAVLYRINALSRALEEGLNRFGIAYKMIGGVKFYERMEIKDLIAYLRLVTNPHDDFSFKRVINRPKRGIGKVSIDKLEQLSKEKQCSIHHLVLHTSLNDVVGVKNATSLIEFAENILSLQEISIENKKNIISELDSKFGIKKYYSELPDGLERVANIDEFYGLLQDQITQQNDTFGLEDFLNELSLQSDQDCIDTQSISVMSIHASKGLEFDYVFVLGLEEGYFPILGEGVDLEEERRLGYVAITRAKKELFLSFVGSRFYKGKRSSLPKSRFLSEAGLIQGGLVLEKTSSFKKGDLIRHKIFGAGRVVDVSKSGKEFKLKINFGGSTRDILSTFVEKI